MAHLMRAQDAHFHAGRLTQLAGFDPDSYHMEAMEAATQAHKHTRRAVKELNKYIAGGGEKAPDTLPPNFSNRRR